MRRTYKWRRLSAIAVGLALVAAACGDDDDSGGGATTTAASGGATTTAAGATTTAGSGGATTTAGSGGGDTLADDAVDGMGAEAWETALKLSKDNPLQAEGEEIVIALPNLEGSAGGTFPEIREGAEAAVKLINEQLGGVGADLEAGTPGRPLRLETCIHKIDQAEAQACATQVKEANPNLVIVGIDFFTPLMYPVWEGLPIMETVPIFVADFDQPGVVSAFGGCVAAFPGAALYQKEVKEADRVAVIYSDNAPGNQCYEDTQKRFYEYLELPHQGFPEKPGDPSDNDANVQAVLNYLDGAENPYVTFGIAASDCAEYIKALNQAGYEGGLTPAGSCVDESVYADPSAEGAQFEFQGYIDQEGLGSEFVQFEMTEREAAITEYGPQAPRSTFMRVAFAAVVWGYQVMNDLVAEGEDPTTPEVLIEALASVEDYHIVGYPPVNCANNSADYESVCKKSVQYASWDGSTWVPDPDLGGEFLDLTELLASVPPRPAG